MRLRRALLVLLAVASAARADDPPAKPRHENKVTPAARAAMERFKALVYRPAEHGLESATGVVVPVGLASHEHPTFEWKEGRLLTGDAPQMEAETKRLNLGSCVRYPLSVAFDASDVFADAECDADLVDYDGRRVLELTAYRKDVRTERSEFVLDKVGVVSQHVWKGEADDKRGDYLAKYTWTKCGEQRCVGAIEVTMEGADSTHYACVFRYADVEGVHVVTSYEFTYFVKSDPPKTVTFHVADLVLNGKKIDLPTPWKHANKVTPEADAAIEACRKLVYRPAEHGLRSMSSTFVVDGAPTPPWRFAFAAPTELRFEPVAGARPTPGQSRMALLQLQTPLRAAFLGMPPFDGDEHDAEFVDRDGARTLVVTEYRDGAKTSTSEFRFAETGLLASASPAADASFHPVMRLTWERVGDLNRIAAIDLEVAAEGRSMRVRSELSYASAGGVEVLSRLVSTMTVTENRATNEARADIRLAGVMLNGAGVELPGPRRHENRVSPEAKAAMDRYASLVYRPAEHGLVSMSGTLMPEWTDSPCPPTFQFAAPNNVFVTPAPNAGGDAAAAKTVSMTNRFALLAALDGLRLAESPEFDADVVEKDGVRTLFVTEYRSGARSDSLEIALDAEGLASSYRRLDGPDPNAPRTDTRMRLRWTVVGDRRAIESFELTSAATEKTVKNTYSFSYAEVAGFWPPKAYRRVVVENGKETTLAHHLEDVVVNGKKVELPAPAAAPK